MPLAAAGFVQVSYEIEIERSGAVDTFAVDSADQVLVPWPAAPLKSRERVSVRVRVRDRSGSWSGWSDPVRAEAGLLDPTDWTARFVSPRGIGGLRSARSRPSAEFSVPEGAVSARLYSTAHGIYVADLNGRRVSEDQFAPGWTAYDARLRYQVYDVTAARRARTQRARPPCSATAGIAADSDTSATERSTAIGSPSSRSSRSRWHPVTSSPSPPTRTGAAPRAASSRTTSTTARPPTCGIRPRLQPRTMSTSSKRITLSWSPPKGHRSGKPKSFPRNGCGDHRSGRTLVDFGQNARRPGAVARPRIRRQGSEILDPPRGGARKRRAWHAAPARCGGHRHGSS